MRELTSQLMAAKSALTKEKHKNKMGPRLCHECMKLKCICAHKQVM